MSQDDAARLLTTNSAGTPWSYWNFDVPGVPAEYSTNHPVGDVLNYKTNNANPYLPHDLPYSPSSSDVSYYEGALISNMGHGWPIIGNAEEIHGGPRLRGHPNPDPNLPIGHWFTISGYENNGSESDYMDSATTVWATVKGWNTLFASDLLVTIMGDRGYVW